MGFILKKLKNFITYKKYILAACTLSLSLTIPYISYATTQDNLDDANQKLEELRQQQGNVSNISKRLCFYLILFLQHQFEYHGQQSPD